MGHCVICGTFFYTECKHCYCVLFFEGQYHNCPVIDSQETLNQNYIQLCGECQEIDPSNEFEDILPFDIEKLPLDIDTDTDEGYFSEEDQDIQQIDFSELLKRDDEILTFDWESILFFDDDDEQSELIPAGTGNNEEDRTELLC